MIAAKHAHVQTEGEKVGQPTRRPGHYQSRNDEFNWNYSSEAKENVNTKRDDLNVCECEMFLVLTIVDYLFKVSLLNQKIHVAIIIEWFLFELISF
jgi:hypothetical protein